jgi:hypothetical protein
MTLFSLTLLHRFAGVLYSKSTKLLMDNSLVELYGKLIGVVLTHFLIAPLRMPEGLLSNREISSVQVRKTLQHFARDLNRRLGHPTQFQVVLADMLSRIKRFGFKQKRKKEPNTCHALALAAAMLSVELDSSSDWPLA